MIDESKEMKTNKQRKEGSDFFRYLKLKVKLKKTLAKIWFNKQCLANNITPTYAKIRIKEDSEIKKKVKKLSEKIWIKEAIKNLYKQVNIYNKQLLWMHMELYQKYDYIEIEEILHKFGDKYINMKLEKRNRKIKDKLWRWKSKIEKEMNRDDDEIDIKVGDRIVNLTNVKFNTEETQVLEKCLKYTPQEKVNDEELLIQCESIIGKEKEEPIKKQMRFEVSRIVEEIKEKKNKQERRNKREQMQIRKLKKKIKDNNIMLTKADKGNAVVVIEKEEYVKKGIEFISNENYEEIKYDYTNKFQSRVKRILKESKIFKNKLKVTEVNPIAPRLKCQIKLHKEHMPVRPIVSFIGAPSYKLAKECSKVLREWYEWKNKYNIENNKMVVEKLTTEVEIKENLKLMSLDVVDMYTNIPVNKVLQIIEENKLGGYENKKELVSLIKECMEQNYFRFNNKFYIQKRGLPMGSPMSPLLAEIYMNNMENKIMESKTHNLKIKKWLRYVDDILIIWEGTDEEWKQFVEEINNMEETIKFKMEIGNQEINFLDLNIKMTKDNFIFDIYRKETFTDAIIPNDSYHPMQYKMAAISNYCHRVNNCIRNEKIKMKEIRRIKKIVKNNKYNPNIVDNMIRKIKVKDERGNECIKEKEEYKGSVSYIGYETKKIKDMFKKHNIEIAVKKGKTIFEMINNNNIENTNILEKSGVYMLECGDCDKVYLGETGRKFLQRLKEHKRGENVRTTNSLYARHFMEEGHKFVDPTENYKIIKIINKEKERKLREELEIIKLRKKNERKLMNSKIIFDNEEVFYGIVKNITRENSDRYSGK